MFTAAVAASVADEVALESADTNGGMLDGIVVNAAGDADIAVDIGGLEMFIVSFSILFTGGLVAVEIFSGGS